MRKAAARALGRIGPQSIVALPALVKALGDRDDDVKGAVAVALGRIGPMAARAIPALARTLKVKDASVTMPVVEALGRMGPRAVPYLIRVLKDRRLRMRGMAAVALGEIGPAAAPAIPALIRSFAYRQEQLVWWKGAASGALARIGARAIPPLVVVLGHRRGQVREEAVSALGGMGAKAIPALQQALGDRSAARRWNAARALGMMGAKAAPACQSLVAALRDTDEAVRLEAAAALGNVGTRLAVAPLSRALDDPSLGVRWAAVRALDRMGGKAAPAIAGLKKALGDRSRHVRKSAVNALERIGIRARERPPSTARTRRYTVPDPEGRGMRILREGRPHRRLGFRHAIKKVALHPDLPLAAVQTKAPGLDGAFTLFLVDLRSGRRRDAGIKRSDLALGAINDPDHLWSPDGRFVVLLKHVYGPFWIFRSRDLPRWIAGKPVRPVKVSAPAEHEMAQGHSLGGWTSIYELVFTAGCCDGYSFYSYDLRIQPQEPDRRGSCQVHHDTLCAMKIHEQLGAMQ